MSRVFALIQRLEKPLPETKARSERGEVAFRVKEYGPPDYAPFIVAEHVHSGKLTLIGNDAFLAFDLNTRDIHEAEQIATFLNQHIAAVGFTIFGGHPMFNAKPRA
jgi:hypothetical protein